MKKEIDFLDAYREKSMFRRRELAEPHMSYAYEKEKYRVIREGRVDLLDAVSRLLPDGTGGILSRDALRHQKNMLIAACHGRRASGGVGICYERQLYFAGRRVYFG